MRRKRRSQGTWFPVIGSPTDVAEAVLPGRRFAIAGTTGIQTATFPLTYDFPRWEDTTVTSDRSIGDIVGNEYIIKRIVGKIHIVKAPDLVSVGELILDDGNPIIVGLGLYVARAGDQAGGGADQPIGSSRDNYSPLDNDNVREPWMFHRTWVLGSGTKDRLTDAAIADYLYAFPASTAGYGSVMDGPHLDVKSRRRVGQEDRLWCSVSVAAFEAGGPTAANQNIEGFIQTRIFAQLVKPRNKGSF